MLGNVLTLLAILAVLAALGWFWLRPRFDLRIVADRAGIVSHQGIAEAQLPALEEFFRRDVDLPGRVTIHGRRKAGGPIQLKVHGQLSEGVKQQIRNFLLSSL